MADIPQAWVDKAVEHLRQIEQWPGMPADLAEPGEYASAYYAWVVINAVKADIERSVHRGLRVEIQQQEGKPIQCQVWRDGVLVFDGQDRSAVLSVQEDPDFVLPWNQED